MVVALGVDTFVKIKRAKYYRAEMRGAVEDQLGSKFDRNGHG
jgi:hypothetical protein